MPHIHTEPGQRDMTVSAYIVRRNQRETKCLVHFHRKVEILMQIGGHIELDETPWQSMAHELPEESGYQLDELRVLQPYADQPLGTGNIFHPTPFLSDTHNVGHEHYHSDLCYAFVADAEPREPAGEGESADLRWLSLTELEVAAKRGEAMMDCYYIYEYLLRHIDSMVEVPATEFSLEKPTNSGLTYKYGTPGDC
jgi:8-oxo-dGTP pyrophosphatase MutT (NUDIX family)